MPNENDCWKHLHVYKWECGDTDYMLDHGYIGNFEDGELMEPGYMDEEFVDAASYLSEDSSTTKEGSIDEGSDGVGRTINPPAIELPSSFPVLASGCLRIPKFTNYAVGKLPLSC